MSQLLADYVLYYYEEQIIGFSLNCCTRTCNSAHNPRPIVENIWYWIWEYFKA